VNEKWSYAGVWETVMIQTVVFILVGMFVVAGVVGRMYNHGQGFGRHILNL
jgi:hypothetical protein